MSPPLTSAFHRHVLWTVVTNIALSCFGVITGVLVARLLGPEGRGELAAIQVWPSFIVSLGTLGLSEAVVYFSARDQQNIGRYAASAATVAFLSSLPFAAIGYFLMPIFLAAHSAEIITVARWYLLIGPLMALLDIPVHVLRANKDFIIWNALRLVPAVGWLGVVAYAVLTFRAEAAFIAGWYLFSLAVLCVPILYVVKSRTARPWRPDILASGPLVRYGLQCHANGLAQLCNVRLDQLLIAAVLPVQSLGLYAVAVAWSSGLQPLSSAFGAVLFPEVASRTSRGAQSHAVAYGSRLGIIATIVVGIAVLAVTPWAVQLLFGESFSGAIPAALVLVITAVVGGVSQVIEGGIRGMGAPGIILQAELARLGVMIVCLLLFLFPWGILGAAFASFAGTSVSTGLLVYRAKRLARVEVIESFGSARSNTQPL